MMKAREYKERAERAESEIAILKGMIAEQANSVARHEAIIEAMKQEIENIKIAMAVEKDRNLLEQYIGNTEV